MHTRSLPLLAPLAFAILLPGPAGADTATKNIYQRTLHGTCWIIVQHGNGASTGTGWVVDRERKLVVTNQHVVENEDKVIVVFPQFREGKVVAERKAYSEERGCRGKVLDTDVPHDLAVIQLIDPFPEGTQELKLATGSPDPADRVHSIGNPGASEALWVYTSGTVRQVHESEWSSLDMERRKTTLRKSKIVATQAPINPGDSGGPVVDDEGNLIGVNSSTTVRNRGKGNEVQLITHAIDVAEVRAFVDQTRKLIEPKTAESFLLRGNRLLERQKYTDAIADYSAALKLDRKLAAAYRQRGWAFACKGDHDTTIADCNEATRLDPDDAISYENRGWAYERKGNTTKAIEDYTRAIQLDPKFSRAYNNRGIVYYRAKDLNRALADFSRAIEADPKNAVALGNRGDTCHDLNQHERAIKDCTEALNIDPFLTHAWNARGYAFRDLKMHDDHISNFQQAVYFNPRNTALLVSLGNALTFKNQWKDAVAYYNKALDIDKDCASAYFFRGSAHEEFGLINEAQDDYNKAIKLDSGYKSRVKSQNRCLVRVANDTKEVLRIYIQYEYQAEDGSWVWYPNNGTARTLDVQPGKNVQLVDDDWKVECRRCRIWAVGQTSNLIWDKYRNQDWWLCKDPYLARNRVSLTHTFK
jgi:tetratricopeptide (TPR) repeat protein